MRRLRWRHQIGGLRSPGLLRGLFAGLLGGIVGLPGPLGAQESGEPLYRQHCASCHGLQLEGQGDWRSARDDGTYLAPPHDGSGHSWHHGDALLRDYINLGGQAVLERMGVSFNSGMPGFADKLDQGEVDAILGYLKSNWTPEQRDYQAQRTASE